MNKEDYSQLHYLLAKLKFELAITICESSNGKYIEETQKHIESIDDIMQVFIIGENKNE